MRGVYDQRVPTAPPSEWPAIGFHGAAAIVSFEPQRLFHGREEALWVPEPSQVVALGRWLRSCGVATLLVVMPHQQGRLPQALRSALAGFDEQALASLGFDRLLIVRSAQKPAAASAGHALQRLAGWMLSIASFMVPQREQPVRAQAVARFAACALQTVCAANAVGTWVAAPEQVWQAAQVPERPPEVNGQRLPPSERLSASAWAAMHVQACVDDWLKLDRSQEYATN
jgi:hypothetical protein